MEYALVFVAMMTLDFCYAEYTKTAADRKALPAASWAVGVILLTSFVTRHYVADWTFVLAAAGGAFAGTYVSIRRGV